MRLFFLLPLALAACSAPQPEGPVLIDRVMPPEEAVSSGVLSPNRLLAEGSATWVTTTVGELMERRAVTEAERERAARTAASGAYLGDPAQIMRLTPAGVTGGSFVSGAAYLTDAFPPEAAPGPFEMSVTFELSGSEGASAGLTLELRSPGARKTGDTGHLLVTLLDPSVGGSAQLTVSTREAGGDFEPVASVPLAARDWRGSHRLDLDYAPGRLVVRLDDEPLAAPQVRLDRPAGPVYVGAFASVPTMGVSIVDWSFTTR